MFSHALTAETSKGYRIMIKPLCRAFAIILLGLGALTAGRADAQAVEADYKLHAGDKIQVSVWKEVARWTSRSYSDRRGGAGRPQSLLISRIHVEQPRAERGVVGARAGEERAQLADEPVERLSVALVDNVGEMSMCRDSCARISRQMGSPPGCRGRPRGRRSGFAPAVRAAFGAAAARFSLQS